MIISILLFPIPANSRTRR